MLRVVRWQADKLKRFNATALLCVLCVVLSGCAGALVFKPGAYELHTDDFGGPPLSRMIPVETENGQVYRYMIDGLEETGRVLVRHQGGSHAITVEPDSGRAVVEYRPVTDELLQLPGTWHLFSYEPGEGIDLKSVHLAGSFNGWSTHALPMFDRGDGVYVALVKLSEGVHWYKFVADDETWINDPASDTEFERPDGNYGMNSAVLVGVDARDLSEPRPNHIEASAVVHDPSDVPDVAAASESLLRLSIRMQAGDVEHVSVLIANASDSSGWKRYALQPSGRHVGLERYGALIQVAGKPVRYVFELVDGDATMYCSADGLTDSLEVAERSAYSCDMRPGFVTPDWAKDAVWYQVFPERFRNGSTANDPPKTQRWRADWWATLPGEVLGQENFYRGAGNVWWRRFGGDIQGVQEALPYLRELGVNTLYFNPVFEARSMHKYDTSDFRHVDDNLTVIGDPADLAGETDDPATWRWSAGDKVFLDFVKEAHRQGFKVVLDGVFNHVGEKHYAFVDVLENGRDSRYADWFDIIDWGTGGEPGKPGGVQWRGWDHDLSLIHI